MYYLIHGFVIPSSVIGCMFNNFYLTGIKNT